MVFEHLTLFQIDLDGAHIGPRVTTADDEHSDETMATDAGGRGRFLPMFVFLALAVGATMLSRRSRRSDVAFESEADEAAEADLAEAQ